jgi:hypothetical protein
MEAFVKERGLIFNKSGLLIGIQGQNRLFGVYLVTRSLVLYNTITIHSNSYTKRTKIFINNKKHL